MLGEDSVISVLGFFDWEIRIMSSLSRGYLRHRLGDHWVLGKDTVITFLGFFEQEVG